MFCSIGLVVILALSILNTISNHTHRVKKAGLEYLVLVGNLCSYFSPVSALHPKGVEAPSDESMLACNALYI